MATLLSPAYSRKIGVPVTTEDDDALMSPFKRMVQVIFYALLFLVALMLVTTYFLEKSNERTLEAANSVVFNPVLSAK